MRKKKLIIGVQWFQKNPDPWVHPTFSKKLILKLSADDTKIVKNYPACRALSTQHNDALIRAYAPIRSNMSRDM